MDKIYLFETKRLKLRELNESDILHLSEILSDPVTMKYYPSPYDIKEVEGWIYKSRKSYNQNGFGLWALELKDDDSFIGQCGIANINIDGEIVPEIGYHINKKYWNQGYATEAAYAVMNYGFKNFNFKEIFIHTWNKNIPSQRIAEKIGMVKLKEFDKNISKHNLVMRHVVYSVKYSDKVADDVLSQ